jgi:hypothetical protein
MEKKEKKLSHLRDQVQLPNDWLDSLKIFADDSYHSFMDNQGEEVGNRPRVSGYASEAGVPSRPLGNPSDSNEATTSTAKK